MPAFFTDNIGSLHTKDRICRFVGIILSITDTLCIRSVFAQDTLRKY